MEQKTIHEATLFLPPNAKTLWTAYMQAETPVPEGIYESQPIVMAVATFADGTWVAGGVMKSKEPDVYNIKFFNTFDANGNLITEPRQPIDPSDHEDFHHGGCIFNLNDDESVEYHLTIVERTDAAAQ
ncbi:MAG: hypothetical protein JNL70_16815 [Saprospiraceae bacterium]|nr:hypothetical protein [Saprospiraceae bacterium]